MKRYYKILFLLVIFVAALVLTIHQNTYVMPAFPRESVSLAGTGGKDETKSYDLSSLQTLNGVLLLLSKCYVDPSRFNPQKMYKEALYAMQDEVPSLIARFDDSKKKVEVQVGAKKKTFSYSKIDGPWSMSAELKKVFNFIKNNLQDYGDIKPEDIEYAAINGMLSTLDPHTRLLPPDFYKEMKMDTEGEFGGLGIVISSPEGKLTINEVLEGTPAEKEGLKCGDHVVQIEEESTVNMDLDEAVSKLRGKAGTKVTIWIMREGLKDPKKVVIERAGIHIESIKYHLLSSNVGYVQLSSFQENTYEDLKNALEKLKQGGMKSLILDLRNDAGGLLDASIVIADIFIYAGTVTTTFVPCSKDPMQPYPAKISGSEPNYPMVVLVNRGSASASEIVAGALKNHDRALIMGERTFGKGSIQQLKELRDGSALKYTIGEYLTPGDISIQSIGVVPDVQLVPMIINKKNMDIFFSDMDVFRESDLDRHLVSDKIMQELKPKEIVEYVYIAKDEKPKDVCPPPFKKIIKDDYEVKVARDLLESIDNPNRLKMIQDSAEFLNLARADQSQELTKALKKLKIDWEECSSEESHSSSDFEVTFYQSNKKVDAFALKAGSKSKIKIEVKNNGKHPICRLYSITKSDNRLLNKREFIFGKIQPGKKKSWEMEIEVPKSYSSRVDPLDFTFFTSPEKKIFSAPEIRAEIKAIARPLWNVAYSVSDDIKGDGDGILEPGEEGKVKIYVHNKGKGKSKSLAAAIKNLSGDGVYISKGRESIKNLAPGKEAAVELKIKLLPTFSKKDFKLKVIVQDADFPVYYGKEATFPASGEGKGGKKKESLTYDHIPVIHITSTDPDLGEDGCWNVQTKYIILKGTVKDDSSVEDLYVYAGEDKIYYKSNAESGDQAKMEFEIKVPLHGGVNIINILARQDFLTTARKKLIIRRDNPDGSTMPTPKKGED